MWLVLVFIVFIICGTYVGTHQLASNRSDKPEDCYRFDPQPDITTYQLAQILAHGSTWQPICETPDHPVPGDIKSQLRVIK